MGVVCVGCVHKAQERGKTTQGLRVQVGTTGIAQGEAMKLSYSICRKCAKDHKSEQDDMVMFNIYWLAQSLVWCCPVSSRTSIHKLPKGCLYSTEQVVLQDGKTCS